MFCYCAKCVHIKNITTKAARVCEVCGTPMQPVPQEYLMSSGSFFKSQAVRQQFIESIQAAPEYDEEIGSKKDEIKKAAEEQEKARIQEMNEKMRQEQFHMICPVCQSRSIQRISSVERYAVSAAERYVSGGALGVLLGTLGTGDVGKTWKCNVCGHKF